MSTEIYIPAGTSLRIEVYGVPEALNGNLIGIESGILVVKTPSESFIQGLKNKLYKGNSVVVYYNAKNSSYKFVSNLLGAVSDPLDLVFIKMPETLEKDDQRVSQRIECHLPGTFKTEDNEFRGILQNISTNGCKCSVTQSSFKDRMTLLFIFEEGKSVDISFNFPKLEKDFALEGKMRHLNSSSDNVTFGIEFDTLPPDLLEKIDNAISGKEAS